MSLGASILGADEPQNKSLWGKSQGWVYSSKSCQSPPWRGARRGGKPHTEALEGLLPTVKPLLGCKPMRCFCCMILLERAKYRSDSTFQFAEQAGKGHGFREARRASRVILKTKHFPKTGLCLMEGSSPPKPETDSTASGGGWDASLPSPAQLIHLSSPTWGSSPCRIPSPHPEG